MSDTGKHDPYAHDASEARWTISPFSGDGDGSCVAFCMWPNGDMWISDDKIPLEERTFQAYRRDERLAVLTALVAGSPEAPFVLTAEERQELLAAVFSANPDLALV